MQSAPAKPPVSRRTRRLLIALILTLSASLAYTSLRGDSITFDETSHLTSGLSYWLTGDFRLAPDHPPLAKMWAALPLLLFEHHWSRELPGWEEGVVWSNGVAWFANALNRDALLTLARCMIVLLALATAGLVYLITRALLGFTAAMLALTVTALSPTMLAHGHLVTTDVPATLLFLVTLWAFARLAERITPNRVAASAGALTALALTKFSWPLVIPALLVMGILAAFRRAPWPMQFTPRSREHLVYARGLRRGALLLLVLFTGATVWVGIWAGYGFRYSPYAADATTRERDPQPQDERLTEPASWAIALTDASGSWLSGATPVFVRWARAKRFLPEAYLYGLAYTAKTTRWRQSYLLGEVSPRGRPEYFPIAFAIKTPVAVMLLAIAGIAAIAGRRAVVTSHRLLWIGLIVFTVSYALFALFSNLNIGHRHLLPVYPLLFISCGAATAWATQRAGRLLIVAALVWLVAANLIARPHYLSYFNELIGGPRNGHRYLADSNIDWGQDLKRLAEYVANRESYAGHPAPPIKLAYFGMADPAAYGVNAQMLPSSIPWGSPAELTGGLYIVSVTQWLGVYDNRLSPSYWRRSRGARFYTETWNLREEGGEIPPESIPWMRTMAACKVISRLADRPPDDRVGWSLLVYELSDAEVAEMITP